MLCSEGVLKEPLLYLSLYLKSNRQTYYDYLQSVRETGDWEAWIKFFLVGVAQTANQAVQTAQSIVNLFNDDRKRIESSGKSTVAILKIYNYLQHQSISNTRKIIEVCKVSLPTVLRSMNALEKMGIVKEITGKDRHKIFVYKEYMDILSQGTEPFRF